MKLCNSLSCFSAASTNSRIAVEEMPCSSAVLRGIRFSVVNIILLVSASQPFNTASEVCVCPTPVLAARPWHCSDETSRPAGLRHLFAPAPVLSRRAASKFSSDRLHRRSRYAVAPGCGLSRKYPISFPGRCYPRFPTAYYERRDQRRQNTRRARQQLAFALTTC